MIAIYLAGPMGAGPRLDSVRRGIEDAGRLRAAGFAVFAPHRSALDELVCGPSDYEAWMREDFEWIARCDVLVRMPGESPGADREVAHAQSLGLPVFYGAGALIEAMPPESRPTCRPAPDVQARHEAARRILHPDRASSPQSADPPPAGTEGPGRDRVGT